MLDARANRAYSDMAPSTSDIYTIGQLASAANVPTSTLRFYERVGLLKPCFRTGGNYRGYTAPALARLRFIRSAQATGLSLTDIEALLDLTDGTEAPCDAVLLLMRRRLDEIRQRIRELRQVETLLAKSLHRCCQGDDPDICQDVCRLSGSTATPKKASARKTRRRA